LAGDLFVNNRDSLCLEEEPCFSSIQRAIDRARPGDHIQIQPGVYNEQLRIRNKNNFVGAGDPDRIVIGRAEGAPVDSVILEGSGLRGNCGVGAIQIARSKYVTISGLVITGFDAPAIRLRGDSYDNADIDIERSRIFGNGSEKCGGGIVIESGNADTLVVNNLIYANGGNGIELSGASLGDEGRFSRRRAGERPQAGGPHYLVQNTIHGNGENGVAISENQSAILANNALTGNGSSGWKRRGLKRRGGYGVMRVDSRYAEESVILLASNILCGNFLGEVDGPVFAGAHADNLTPTGTEDPDVLASPECVIPYGVYENMEGVDGLAGTLDDDFTLTGPGGQGMPSPAIDRGVDARTLGLDAAADPLLLADFLVSEARPIQRDINRPLEFDIGALELRCACSEACESCQIVMGEDGSSVDRCIPAYNPATQCCNRLSGVVSSKELGQAFDVCRDTRTHIPGFDPEGNADGCSAVPNQLVLCPAVRLGCDEDAGEENCPEGIDLPCNNHDFCYQTCGVTKQECDFALFDDIVEVCNNMTPAQKILCYDDCLATATIYFDGVVAGAASAYRNGQNRSCQCCQDVFFAPEPQQ